MTALAFSPEGNLLASGGRRPGNAVRIWTHSVGGIWRTGTLVRSFISTSTSNNVQCVTFSPDGKLVAWGRNADQVLKIGRIADAAHPTLGSGANPVFSIAFSPDGRALAATDRNTIQIWTNGASWSSWALCETLTNEAERACCLAFSPNGNLLLCGREDGTLTMSANTRGALGPPPLTFTSFKADAAGVEKIGASVQRGTHYVLQTSTNLQDWSFLATAMSLSNTSNLTAPASSNSPVRFHRAVTPP